MAEGTLEGMTTACTCLPHRHCPIHGTGTHATSDVDLPPGVDPYYVTLAPGWPFTDAHALFGMGVATLSTSDEPDTSDAELAGALAALLDRTAEALGLGEVDDYEVIPVEAQRLREDFEALAATHHLARSAYEVALAVRPPQETADP